MHLSDFATAKHPLRCSRLPEFMLCSWKSLMSFLEIYQRDGGSAADTGSAVHKAIHAWHTHGKEVKKALASMEAATEEYPMADLQEAAALFRLYTEDPKNEEAKVVYAEQLVQGQIDKGVFLEGTLDQIREEEGVWKVMDVKTSRKDGPGIRNHHAFQLAAYAYLASRRYKRPVLPGAVIMVRGYQTRSKQVFFPYSLTSEDVVRMMKMVADRVRAVRAGIITAVPCELCDYCIGINTCIKKLRDYEQESEHV